MSTALAFGLTIAAATALNTNQDKYEASTNPYPVVEAFLAAPALYRDGLFSVGAEGRCFWWQQRAHGSRDESVDGNFMSLGCLAGPRLALELSDRFSLYTTVGAGAAYQDLDPTQTSQTRQNLDKSGPVFSWRGALGLETSLTETLSIRTEGFYSEASPMEQIGGGVSLVWNWN